MPRAASICLVPGCVQRTHRDGRCATHAPAAWTRTSARNTDRTQARAWDRLVRPRALVRDSFRCRRCSSREELEVDHVLPIAQGGTWTLENAQVLCRTCHADKTAEDRRQ